MDPRFRQLAHRDGAETQHVAHHDVHAAGVARLDEGATLDALLQAKHASHLEAAQRLAQHVAADAELLRQIALGGQLVAGLEHAERQLLADPRADLLEGAPRVNRPERHGGRRAGRPGDRRRVPAAPRGERPLAGGWVGA